MTFGEKVKYVRGELQLSQTQLAAELGVSFATVNRWETQNIEPRFLTKVKFEKFCEYRGIALENCMKTKEIIKNVPTYENY